MFGRASAVAVSDWPAERRLRFILVSEPITLAVTKHGGQPVWRDRPMWPLSRSTGVQMRFIGQIRMGPEFGGAADAMAYVFMTEPWPDRPDLWVDGTWDAEGGENAVVLQPGDPPPVDTAAQPTGPTLVRLVDSPDGRRREPQVCEYRVSLESVSETEVNAPLSSEHTAADFKRLQGSKLGGMPAFVQDAESPLGQGARLLLQLDSEDVPFWINFGDGGIGYVFVSSDNRKARFLWQGS